MTSRLTRTAAALLAAVIMLSLFAGAALAAVGAPSEDISFAERGITAQGIWESCDDPDADGITRCEMTQAYVFAGRQRSNDEFGHANASLRYLCVYHHQVAFGEDGVPVEPPVVEQGCADDADLTVVDTLQSLTASAPALELTEEICIEDPETGGVSCEPGGSRTVAVDAAFTGIGSISADRWSSKSRSLLDGVRCTFASSGSGIRREAVASVTIDGTTIEPSALAMLSDGKTRFTQRCG